MWQWRESHGCWSGLVGRTPQLAKVLYGSYLQRLLPRNFLGLLQTFIRYYNLLGLRYLRQGYRCCQRY